MGRGWTWCVLICGVLVACSVDPRTYTGEPGSANGGLDGGVAAPGGDAGGPGSGVDPDGGSGSGSDPGGGSGSGSGGGPVTFTMTTSTSFAVSGGGTVAISPTGASCGASCASFPSNTSVTLTATPDTGSRFVSWLTGPCALSSSPTCAFSLTADTAAAAAFSSAVDLTTTKAGAGTGTVTSNLVGIDCGLTCDQGFPPGTNVTLTATPDSDSVFVGWSGACTGSGSCVVTMNGALTVGAIFGLQQRNLQVSLSTGRMTSDVGGIDCPSVQCSANFDIHSVVTLTAVPNPTQVFNGWSGCPQTQGPTCIVTMDTDQTVSVKFLSVTHVLQVVLAGTGTGRVSGSLIDCPSHCSAELPQSVQVTLVARPDPGSVFTGWTSGPCAGSSLTSCTVTMTTAMSVTATFDLGTTLTMGSQGKSRARELGGQRAYREAVRRQVGQAHAGAARRRARPAPPPRRRPGPRIPREAQL